MSTKVLSKDNFKDQIEQGITLVDFWAPWCGPCKLQLPIIDELAEEWKGKAVLAKVNVDEEPDLSSHYGIMSIPTLMLFKDGNLIETMTGFQPRQKLEEKLTNA
jgi:thioredoxin 1